MSVKKFIFPSILGLFGVSFLFMLGIWQLNRLEWKNNLLAKIEDKMLEPPIEMPLNPIQMRDQYRSVSLSGMLVPEELHVLTSVKRLGPGFLIVSPFILEDGRKILLDRGFVAEINKNTARYNGKLKLVGNLFWPNETDGFTPKPNKNKNIWFARNLELMASYLGTEKIMVVASKSLLDFGLIKQPLNVHLPNNHLQYAITWFSLAVIWFLMSIYFILVVRKKMIIS